jgi:hypothetical protein
MKERQVELAAERFISLAGSKRAAMRAIGEATTKGKRGRPRGAQYLQADAQILWLVSYLQGEYQRGGKRIPGLRKLTSRLVEICWPLPPPDKLSVAKHLMGCVTLGGAADKRTVITRLMGRDSVWAALRKTSSTKYTNARAVAGRA